MMALYAGLLQITKEKVHDVQIVEDHEDLIVALQQVRNSVACSRNVPCVAEMRR